MSESDKGSKETNDFDWLFEDVPERLDESQKNALQRYKFQRLGQQLLPLEQTRQIEMFITLLNPESAEMRDDAKLVSLYLRPFNSDYNFHYSYADEGKYLENVLNDLIGHVAPVFAFNIGKEHELVPDDKGTQSRFTPHENWQAEVRSAMETCAPIFVLPSGDPGILWEIRELQRKSLLGKTIFIMPYTSTYVPIQSAEAFWDDACLAFLREFETELPRYPRRGAWFTLNESLSLNRITVGNPPRI